MADRRRRKKAPRARPRAKPARPPASLSRRARELAAEREHADRSVPHHPPIEPVVSDGEPFRSGLVALVGRPNVGKSTILNRVLGRKLAATTHKPQTTRKNLLGILNPPGAQIAFLDTPGHHQAEGPLNRFMVAQAEDAMEKADLIAFVVEARPHAEVSPGNARIVRALKRVGKPVVVLVNKVDRVREKNRLLLQLDAYAKALGDQAVAIVPLSARRSRGLEEAVREIGRALPESDALFADDELTDQPERSIAAEFIREKVMLELQDELPYAATVTIDDWSDERPRLVRMMATVHVERQAQKGIVVGKGDAGLEGLSRALREGEPQLDEQPSAARESRLR
jgi:GTP-binding protein Era